MEAVLGTGMERDVLAAQSGDRTAFARLVDAYRNVVCSITLAIVRDTGSSEDVAQEVFVAAWTGVRKLRSVSSFLPWLRQLARNQANEFVRSRGRYRRRHAPWGDGSLEAPDGSADAAARIIATEEQAALASAIEALPDDTREIVTLYYREGSSARQVADLLGMSEDAVKKRLERARDTLRAAALERFAENVRKTAPGVGFTAAVSAAIVAASPGTAAAASAGAAKSLGHAGSIAKLGPLLGALSGALVGAGSAFAAIGFGTRSLLLRARDEEERRSIRRFGAANLGFVVLTLAGGELATWASAMWLAYAIWLTFIVGIVISYAVWLPRIVARRLASERAEDPDASRRQRRDRIRSTLGIGLGAAAGLAGLLYELSRH